MKTPLLKSSLFTFGIIILLSGCTITRTTYEGSMTYPQNIMFDRVNFKYVKTINGNSRAIYHVSSDGYGHDKKRSPDRLISSAKADMYSAHLCLTK